MEIVPSDENILEDLARIVAEYAHVDEKIILATTRFDEMGVDSLNLQEVLVEAEDHFHIAECEGHSVNLELRRESVSLTVGEVRDAIRDHLTAQFAPKDDGKKARPANGAA